VQRFRRPPRLVVLPRELDNRLGPATKRELAVEDDQCRLIINLIVQRTEVVLARVATDRARDVTAIIFKLAAAIDNDESLEIRVLVVDNGTECFD
jgi:hypothetical protein